jgi:dUTP pyrophosphatase
MKNVEIKVVNTGNQELPVVKFGNAGMDLRANIQVPVQIKPLERVLVPTGLHIQLPEGFEAQIRPRSGLALKHGITVLNTPGTIDSSFRGDIGIILINLSNEVFTVNPGDRIAQMVIAEHAQAIFMLTDSLDETERGEGGFGHSGVK